MPEVKEMLRAGLVSLIKGDNAAAKQEFRAAILAKSREVAAKK
jgi:hypothetical protein